MALREIDPNTRLLISSPPLIAKPPLAGSKRTYDGRIKDHEDFLEAMRGAIVTQRYMSIKLKDIKANIEVKETITLRIYMTAKERARPDASLKELLRASESRPMNPSSSVFSLQFSITTSKVLGFTKSVYGWLKSPLQNRFEIIDRVRYNELEWDALEPIFVLPKRLHRNKPPWVSCRSLALSILPNSGFSIVLTLKSRAKWDRTRCEQRSWNRRIEAQSASSNFLVTTSYVMAVIEPWYRWTAKDQVIFVRLGGIFAIALDWLWLARWTIIDPRVIESTIRLILLGQLIDGRLSGKV